MLKITKLINSPLFTGGRVRRYSGLHLVEPESLSDHTYETVLMSLLIYKELERLNLSHLVDKGSMLEKALLHDLDESVMGDIPRTVKYADPRLKPALDDVSVRYINSLTAPFDISIESEFLSCKDGSYEGKILKVVDLILVARKAIRELDLKNNREFLIVVDEVNQYLAELKFNLDDNIENYLFKLVEDTRDTCSKVLENHQSVDRAYLIKRKGI